MGGDNYKRLEELMDYLTADEKIISKYRMSVYDVVTTTERLILLRRFPPAFIEIGYEEINNLEHRTTILWNDLLTSIATLVLAVVIFVNERGFPFVEPINNIVGRYIPELANTLPTLLVVQVVMMLSTAASIIYFAKFVGSLSGYFRISRKNRAPVTIRTAMTPELKNLIREIEGQIKQVKERRLRPAPETAEAAPAAAKPEVDIKTELESRIRGLADNAVILISSKSEKHSEVVSNTLNMLVNEKGMGGVYISISRPYESITSTMATAGIPADDVYFIDCISRMAGKGHTETDEHAVFVENPSSLEEVSMYLDRMLGKVPSEKKFLFLDSLSSLLIYNTDKSVREFTHFLINKIRLEGVSGIIFSIEKKEAEDLVKTLSPMCDVELKF
ncbi:MAG: hypothetical protein GF416_07365 [Candidatus Altiarchaeales archaeon]|nr:hypothetical protein [Candidatus Altiarchaeales archaeon]MBD3416931.1 hypothetical protein [Candidatus Altiarchaeales archaeon]